MSVLFFGCNGASGESDASFAFDAGSVAVDPFGDASLALRARALFSQTCAGGPETGCHFEHAANLTLSLDPRPGDLIEVASTEQPAIVRVAPLRPDLSYVEWKVAGDPRIDGSVMPYGAYDVRVANLVTEWIEAGAP